MSSRWRRSSSSVKPSASASSSRSGRRPCSAVNSSTAFSMSRSQRRTERGAQSWRRISSSTAPCTRVHAYCSSVAPLLGVVAVDRLDQRLEADRDEVLGLDLRGHLAHLAVDDELHERRERQDEPVADLRVAAQAVLPPEPVQLVGAELAVGAARGGASVRHERHVSTPPESGRVADCRPCTGFVNFPSRSPSAIGDGPCTVASPTMERRWEPSSACSPPPPSAHGDLRQARLRRGRRRRRAAARALRPGRGRARRRRVRRRAGRRSSGAARSSPGCSWARSATRRRPGLYFLALERMDASLLSLLLYTYPALVTVAAIVDRPRAGDALRGSSRSAVASAGTALVLLGAGTGALDPLATAMALGAVGRLHRLHPVRRPRRRRRAAGRARVARDRGRDRDVRDRAARHDGPVARASAPRAGCGRRAIALVSTVGGDPRVLRRAGARRAVVGGDPLDARAAGDDRARRAGVRRGRSARCSCSAARSCSATVVALSVPAVRASPRRIRMSRSSTGADVDAVVVVLVRHPRAHVRRPPSAVSSE